MTLTKSLFYFAAAGGLLYFACSKGYKLSSTVPSPVPAPVINAPVQDRQSAMRLHEDESLTEVITHDMNNVIGDASNLPEGYVPIDQGRLTYTVVNLLNALSNGN